MDGDVENLRGSPEGLRPSDYYTGRLHSHSLYSRRPRRMTTYTWRPVPSQRARRACVCAHHSNACAVRAIIGSDRLAVPGYSGDVLCNEVQRGAVQCDAVQ